MLDKKNNFISFLKKNGIKTTRQRNLVFQQLLNGKNRHFTAENLYHEVNKNNFKISLATIYNTLKQFSYFGLIREIVVDQNKYIYCTNDEPHYHLYIEDEEKIIDIPSTSIDLSNIPKIPACLNLHNIDIIVRIRTLKDENI